MTVARGRVCTWLVTVGLIGILAVAVAVAFVGSVSRAYGYDAPTGTTANAHLEFDASAPSGPSLAKLSGSHQWSASPPISAQGTSTTRVAPGVATEAESGVLDGAVCSFDPDTQVLMADGTTKAIKDVAIGDSVEAADPSSGQDQGGRSVTALHSHQDDDLIDINVTGRDGKLHVIHTTARHPFWEDTSRTWVPAGNLRAGQELRTVDGRDVVIADVSDRSGESEMLNLTVSGLHTFYVKAGDVAVLVHNTCGDGFGRGGQRLSPDPAAGGSPHSTFRTDPVTGEVTHYSTWEPNPQNPLGYDPVLRYDGVGGAHFNKIDQIDVPTPHVQGPGIPGGVRPAQPWEIPWR